jgi:hypothetical protein
MRLEKSSQPNDETESALYSDTSPDGSPFRAIESITGGQRDRAKFVTAKFPPSLQWTAVAACLSMGGLKRLPRQRATVSNETGSELGQEFRGDSDNAFRQK